MKETDITQDSQNGQPYIQRNFIRYGRKPILQKTCRKSGTAIPKNKWFSPVQFL